MENYVYVIMYSERWENGELNRSSIVPPIYSDAKTAGERLKELENNESSYEYEDGEKLKYTYYIKKVLLV